MPGPARRFVVTYLQAQTGRATSLPPERGMGDADEVPMDEPRTCPNCGEPVGVTDTVCSNCGTSLAGGWRRGFAAHGVRLESPFAHAPK